MMLVDVKRQQLNNYQAYGCQEVTGPECDEELDGQILETAMKGSLSEP